MRRIIRTLGRSTFVVLLATGFAIAPATSGSAEVPMACDVFNPTGVRVTTYDTSTDTATWEISGAGTCDGGSLNENFNVSFVGSGTSTGLGLCTGDLPTTDLTLFVTATFTNSNRTVQQHQVWTVVVAVQPTSAPLTISGDAVGAGVLSTRIFLKCPGSGGTDAARFVWAQTGP